MNKKNVKWILLLLLIICMAFHMTAFAAGDSEEETDEQAVPSIEYYAFVDGERVLVETQTENINKETDTSTHCAGRYYTTAERLEEVYGEYGFKADEFQGELYFPHTDSNDSSIIWADTNPYQVTVQQNGSTGKEWRIPLSTRDTIYVYYLPANKNGSKSYFNNKKEWTDSTLIQENSFYKVSIADLTGSSVAVNESHYVLTGEDYGVTLPLKDGYEWRIYHALTGETVSAQSRIDSAGGKVHIAISAVENNIRILCKAKGQAATDVTYRIGYKADTLGGQLQWISSEIGKNSQKVLAEGTVCGRAEWSEKISLSDTDLYTFADPDDEYLFVQAGNAQQKKKICYLFQGWREKNTGDLLKTSDLADAKKLYLYESNGNIELEAVWSALDKKEQIPTVNFFLNLTSEIMDSTDNGFSQGSTEMENFTQSIFTTPLYGTESLDVTKLNNNILLAPPTTAAGAYDVDNKLRQMVTTPCEEAPGVTIADFPSDEEVFKILRNNNYEIKIKNYTIPSEYITSDHFQIRWYVLKYQQSDGWHVDGVLVAKQAKLRVTKTFLGNSKARQEIKDAADTEEYGIVVTDNRDNESYTLSLNAAADENRSGYVGYSSYDADTDTYEWILTGHVDGDYSLAEKNYLLSSWQTASYYKVQSSANSSGWGLYTGTTDIKVRMESYATDTPTDDYQTVAFRNYYVKAGVLTIHKADSFSYDGLDQVSFVLYPENSYQPLKLYRKAGTSAYSHLQDTAGEYTEEAEGNASGKPVIVTDENGNIYLTLTEGVYYLEEQFPDGYGGAARIKFEVNPSGQILWSTSYDKNGNILTTTDDTVSGTGTATLNILNNSRLLTTVKAQCDWGSTPEEEQKNVTVRLMCDGKELSTGGTTDPYTQELNASNGWTYEWSNLPLFLNGELAEYTLREVQIGDTYYDTGADTDGYSEYDITADAAKYREGDTGDYQDDATWTDANGVRHYANHVLLKMNNRITGADNRVDVAVKKEWDDEDDKDKIRPDKVTIQLYADGQPVDGSTLELSDSNSWESSFTDLPESASGQKIVYTIQESEVEGYMATITGNSVSGFVVTNKHIVDTKPGDKPTTPDDTKPDTPGGNPTTPDDTDHDTKPENPGNKGDSNKTDTDHKNSDSMTTNADHKNNTSSTTNADHKNNDSLTTSGDTVVEGEASTGQSDAKSPKTNDDMKRLRRGAILLVFGLLLLEAGLYRKHKKYRK